MAIVKEMLVSNVVVSFTQVRSENLESKLVHQTLVKFRDKVPKVQRRDLYVTTDPWKELNVVAVSFYWIPAISITPEGNEFPTKIFSHRIANYAVDPLSMNPDAIESTDGCSLPELTERKLIWAGNDTERNVAVYTRDGFAL